MVSVVKEAAGALRVCTCVCVCRGRRVVQDRELMLEKGERGMGEGWRDGLVGGEPAMLFSASLGWAVLSPEGRLRCVRGGLFFHPDCNWLARAQSCDVPGGLTTAFRHSASLGGPGWGQEEGTYCHLCISTPSRGRGAITLPKTHPS